ncbi:MAG: AAA family ATPase [Candidatus Nezhaarchaeales archaeon]
MTLTVVVTGGKGGTGKSTIVTNVAVALLTMGQRVLLVDSDVDNPNDHIFLDVNPKKITPISIFTPGVDLERCARCGKCNTVCPEGAIVVKENKAPIVYEEACCGCKSCLYTCPYNAIYNRGRDLGYVRSTARGNLRIMVGELKPTEAKSSLAVNRLIRIVKDYMGDYDFVIIDTSPGVHSAVIQALRVADVVIAVSEPTPLGIVTMKMTIDLLNAMKLKWIAFINKSTISFNYREEMVKLCKLHGAQAIFELPYDEAIFKTNMDYKLLVESDNPLKTVLLNLAEYLVRMKSDGEHNT